VTQAHTTRQLEMLGLMGIDVWKLRSKASAGQPTLSHPQVAEADITQYGAVDPADSSMAPSWGAVIDGPLNSDWLFICETDQGGLESATPSGRLYDAVLGAMSLKREDVTTVHCAPQANEIAGAEASSLELALQKLFAGHTPKVAMMLGEACAQGLLKTDKPLSKLRLEKYRYQGGECALVVSHGLARLLDQPLEKAELWKDLLKASALLNAG